MKEHKMIDEYIEAVWVLRERGDADLQSLKDYFGDDYDQKFVDEMLDEGLITISPENGTFSCTETGRMKGRKLIRAHRLAERLLYDVLKIEDYELAACEFEHIIDTDLIDSICILLGHPRKSPDGLPIPEGACCRAERKTIQSPSISVLELRPEESGRVIAVNAENDHQLHLLDVLQIRPGSVIRVHQVAPSIVIECDGSNIAIDEKIASCIYVWKLNDSESQDTILRRQRHERPPGKRRGGRGRWRRSLGLREADDAQQCPRQDRGFRRFKESKGIDED